MTAQLLSGYIACLLVVILSAPQYSRTTQRQTNPFDPTIPKHIPPSPYAPPDKFVILDMAYSGLGEWAKWNNASFFNASFIWTALHNFGDTMGLSREI